VAISREERDAALGRVVEIEADLDELPNKGISIAERAKLLKSLSQELAALNDKLRDIPSAQTR
jgi:hypothetical protein